MGKDEKYDYGRMRGEVLYYYMTHLYPDTEYRSIVPLLIYCFDTTDDAYSFLEKIVSSTLTDSDFA